jgi:hypothetical protein
MKLARAGALSLAFSREAALLLGGCGANGQLTPTARADIQAALNDACPLVSALQPSVAAAFNGNVQAAYSAVVLACPPNPPPTNPVVLGMDLLDALAILKPYLPAKKS